jgi:3-hydroxyacyl-CoA dehydrogenase
MRRETTINSSVQVSKVGGLSSISCRRFVWISGGLSGNADWGQNAPERPDLKTKLISEIDENTASDVVIASSSSGLPSSSFVSKCAHPERVLIGHPFNPPHLMPLVEVVPNGKTSTSHIESAINFYKGLGKRPVLVKQETPGFAANRLVKFIVQSTIRY